MVAGAHHKVEVGLLAQMASQVRELALDKSIHQT